jgi:uncharacterized membrane protein YdfJ with MMPL/SSD domain
MIDGFARGLVRYRWWFVAAGLALLFVGATYGTGVFGALKSGGFTDPKAESSRESDIAATEFAAANPSIIVLMRDDRHTVDAPAFQSGVAAVTKTVSAQPHVTAVTDYYGTGQAGLVSKDRHSTYALITLSGSDNERAKAYHAIKDKLANVDNGLQVKLGGALAANSEVSAQIERDLSRAELISFPLLALLLVVIFRSVIAAALPLIIGALSILGAFVLTRWIASLTDISIFASNIITLLGLGLAIDYSLFLVSRFRDELGGKKDMAAVLARTLHTAGRTIFFSGAIVSLSLLSLLVFPQTLLRSIALGGAATVAFAVLTSLTVLPALLVILDGRINKWALPLPWGRQQDGAGWGQFARGDMRRYPAVLVGALAVLVLAGLPFLGIHYGDEGAKSLPSHFQSRQVSEALEHDFPTAGMAHLEALVTFDDNPADEQHLTALKRYAASLRQLNHVQSVDSAVTVQSGLTAAQYAGFYAQAAGPAVTAKANYFHANRTMVTVKYDENLPEADAKQLLQDVRAVAAPASSTVLVGGERAALTDLLDGLQDRLLPAGLIIGFATFILLSLMLESVVIPLMAIVLSVISLSASFGALTWIFQDGNGQHLLGFTATGVINSTIPILIFVIAFGLAMDYEAFLISRMKEHYNKHQNNQEAIVFGVQKTGRIITSAALLLIVVMLAFATSEIINMKEIGLGLAIAVGVDVLVVRSLLVPAAMRLLGPANWWAPRPVRRLAAHLGLGEV